MVVDIHWYGMDGLYVEDECMLFNDWKGVLNHVTFLEEHGAQMITVYYNGEEVDHHVFQDFSDQLPSLQAC